MDNRCDGTALGNARRRDAGSSVRLDTLQKASLRSVSSRLPDQKDALTTKQQALRVVVDRRASEHGGGRRGWLGRLPVSQIAHHYVGRKRLDVVMPK